MIEYTRTGGTKVMLNPIWIIGVWSLEDGVTVIQTHGLGPVMVKETYARVQEDLGAVFPWGRSDD